MALQAEDDTSGFSEFHLYVCAAFLVKWSEQLQKMDFQVPPFCPSNHFATDDGAQETMVFLQAVPTQIWGEKEMEILLSEAYVPEETLGLGDTNNRLDQVSLEESVPRLGRPPTTRWLGRLRHTKS